MEVVDGMVVAVGDLGGGGTYTPPLRQAAVARDRGRQEER